MEDVFAERIEQERLRRCHIFYFLEDDSIMVIEPAITNSGIPQGKLFNINNPYKIYIHSTNRYKIPIDTVPFKLECD